MNNSVLVDEIGFHLKKTNEYHRCIPNEAGNVSHRHNKRKISKSHFEKVMFFCVVGVPQIRFDETTFDLKIILIPIIDKKTFYSFNQKPLNLRHSS